MDTRVEVAMSPLTLLRSLVSSPSPSSSPVRLRAHAAGRTTVGRRQNNEDRLLVREDLGLFAVADGMGGYEGGEVASQMTIDAIEHLYASHQADEEVTWPHVPDGELSLEGKRAYLGVELAHRAVRARRRGVLAQMGSTVVLFSFVGGRMIVAHAGDSRAALVRRGSFHALTRDDSFLAELESRSAAGSPDERARMAAQFGHVVTKAIGHGESLEPTVRELAVEEGDVFLLSSDGLHGVLEPDELAQTLTMFAPEDACEILLARALEEGSNDNVTCIVVRLERT
jgi:serine/threonine protein phosphatase PrpC